MNALHIPLPQPFFYIDVELTHNRKKVQCKAIIDTGADASIVVQPHIAEQFQIARPEPASAKGVGDVDIRGLVYRNVNARIIDKNNNQLKFENLNILSMPISYCVIGMDILKTLKWCYEDDVLVLQQQ